MMLSASLMDTNPFGVANSAETGGQYPTWMPEMSAAGVKWVRKFPGWGSVEPSDDNWNWTAVDSVLQTAANNNLYVSGFLGYNVPWINSDTQTFPVGHLDDWSQYVSQVVDHAQSQVDYWEVWNEPESFAHGGTAAQYSDIVVSAYDAAKSVDSDAQIGLSIASNDLVYLKNALDAGAAGHYDFICVHPYELLGSVGDDQEAAYMAVVPRIRQMLAEVDPSKADVPIWFTEIGAATNANFSETDQAHALVKAYTMGLAQGVDRIDWFEAWGDNYHMGLYGADNAPNPAYYALDNLIDQLGADPQYQGWVELNGDTYGFVFQGASTSVMVTWAKAGLTSTVNFGQTVQVVDPISGSSSNVSSYNLTNTPVFVDNVPASIITQARANKNLPLAWSGYDSPTSSVSVTMDTANTEDGLHQVYADKTSQAVTAYGGPARYAGLSNAQKFSVAPQFMDYDTNDITISAVVRRNENNDNAGFNLWYESATGWKHIGWNTVPGNSQWYTMTWHITDAQFINKWEYNFRFESDSTTYSKYYIQSVSVTNNQFTAPALHVDVNGTDTSLGAMAAYADQDGANATGTIQWGDHGVVIAKNAWKRWALNYNVTANTKLQFTVDSDDAGEILGIALDNDTTGANSGSRAFQLAGSQNYFQHLTPAYVTGSGDATYLVDVGDYFTGTVNYLGLFVDDDGNASGSATFKNISIYEDLPAGGLSVDVAGSATPLGDPFAYGTGQDGGGSSATQSAADAVTLTGNAWKLWNLGYTVTSDTVLQFTVNSDDTGEILGIALDNDTAPTAGRRGFRFGGSDVNGAYDGFSWKISPTYVAGNGDVTYTVHVGDYFTGSVSYLGLYVDDDADGSGAATFSNISLSEATAITFTSPTAYDSQDAAGSSAVVSGDGSAVTLTDNAWKRWDLDYTVTDKTVVQITVDSSDVGEIMGFALDNDTNSINSGSRAFQFAGSQNYFQHVTPTYVAGSGAITYTINVGEHFTGDVNYLGLFIDDDAGGSGIVTFSNITIFES